MNNLGTLLRQKRREKKLTLENVSNQIGTTICTLSQLETNTMLCKYETLIKLLNLYNINIIYAVFLIMNTTYTKNNSAYDIITKDLKTEIFKLISKNLITFKFKKHDTNITKN